MERLKYENDLAKIAKQISEQLYHHFNAKDTRKLYKNGASTPPMISSIVYQTPLRI